MRDLRHRSRVGLLTASLWLGGPGAATAQEPAGAEAPPDARACAAIESERARLACYDAAVAAAPEQKPAGVSARARAEPAGSRAAETQGGGAAARSGESPPRTAPADGDSSPQAALPETPAPAAQRRDRARAHEGRDGASWVTVVDVRENLSGLAVFTTESGLTYVQTSTRPGRYAAPPFRARLEPASMNSYFLSAEGRRSRVRVSLAD